MTAASLVRLLALSAIWGASFLFMRLGAPVLGPVLLIGCRVLSAALFLAVVGALLRRPLDARRHAAHYLVLGLFNSALPFLLFAFAARTLSASLLSILNATAPIWGAVIGAVWTRTALSPKSLLGLALGVAGVALLVGFDPGTLREGYRETASTSEGDPRLPSKSEVARRYLAAAPRSPAPWAQHRPGGLEVLRLLVGRGA